MTTMPITFKPSTWQFGSSAPVGLQLPRTPQCQRLTLRTLQHFCAQRRPLQIASRPMCSYALPQLKLGHIALRSPIKRMNGSATARKPLKEAEITIKPCAQPTVSTPVFIGTMKCALFATRVPALQLVALLCGHRKSLPHLLRRLGLRRGLGRASQSAASTNHKNAANV
eukprot:GEMP01067323.1.p1 GENE.GEMP01067323.1~~GEMP01067323.1.p1  ORF type:complete len:169 (+),score=20.38 GEMP01067323.1:111-617(+)